jgi:hypothetical protein
VCTRETLGLAMEGWQTRPEIAYDDALCRAK